METASVQPTPAVLARRPARRRHRAAWILIAVLWVGFVALAYWMARYGSWTHDDFNVYDAAARSFAQGVSPYGGIFGKVYLYPPLLSQLLIPLTAFDALTAWHIWFVLNMAALVGTVALFSRYVPARMARLLWLSPLLFEPILDSFYVGQVTIIILALLTGAWAARREGHPALAGVLIAVAAWFKVYPALLLLYFLWKRDWRVVGGIAAAGLALAALQIAISGLPIFLDSFSVLFNLAGNGQTYKIAENASILGFTSQLFVGAPRVIPLLVNSTLFVVSRYGLIALVLAVLLCATQGRLRLPERGREAGDEADLTRFDLEYSLAVISSALISPSMWASGMPPLLLAIWLLWRGGGRVARYLAAFALIILTCHSWYMMGYIGMAILPGVVLSFGFYALAALWGVNAGLVGQKRSETA